MVGSVASELQLKVELETVEVLSVLDGGLIVEVRGCRLDAFSELKARVELMALGVRAAPVEIRIGVDADDCIGFDQLVYVSPADVERLPAFAERRAKKPSGTVVADGRVLDEVREDRPRPPTLPPNSANAPSRL